MAALTRNLTRDTRAVGLVAYPVKGSTTIHKGAQCALDGGYLVPADDDADLAWAGIATEPADNAAGANGALTCLVETEDQFLAGGSGFTAADAGKQVYCVDDNTVALTSDHRVAAGRIVEVVSATAVWVDQRARLDTALADVSITPVELADPAATGNANAEIGGLTFTPAGPTAGECEALRDKCEELADDVRALRATLAALVTGLKSLGLLSDPD